MASADAVTRVWEEKYRELEKLFEQLRLELDGIKRKKDMLAQEVSGLIDKKKMEAINKKLNAIK